MLSERGGDEDDGTRVSDEPYKKKLIEVALPLDAINVASAREKSIRHGHPSTLHLWWARRPLAACRAVLFAQLVDDPSAHPDQFPTEEAQDAERQRLFKIIEDLVKWENSTNEEVLEAAGAEIRRSCDGNPPPILDPFAGGGSIPLEAQRLGLEAHASDLNPVAVLINKALIEIPPRWADQPPVHPEAENRTRWKGAEGLAEDVRRYGQWMCDEADRRIGHLYPKATLADGTEANVIAWIWARTVTCPNPACEANMPLASSFWLGKKKGKQAWVEPRISGNQVIFEIAHGSSGPPDPPKVGRGAKFRCLVCQNIAAEQYIRTEGLAGRLGTSLMAVATEGGRRRVYLPPSSSELVEPPPPRLDYLESPTSSHPQYMGAFRYGFRTIRSYLTNRQLVTFAELARLVEEAREAISEDADRNGKPSNDYASAVCTYLGLIVTRIFDRNTQLTSWDYSPSKEQVRGIFSRQAVQMTWDFAESNIFSSSSGGLRPSVEWVALAVERLPTGSMGTAEQSDARSGSNQTTAISTDPPYYDNVPYSDLSDVLYTPLREMLKALYPPLLSTVGTPKSAELVADAQRHSGRAHAERYFEEGFVETFRAARRSHPTNVPMTVFYAFKQADGSKAEGIASTGWSTMLEGLQSVGWMVTATWPMRTELGNRMRAAGSNALASSVVLSCRPRSAEAGITDRQGLLRFLRHELPGPLHELQKANIAPVDLRQAAIGPGMAIFSRFAKVIEPDGSSMRVRTALGLINGVLDTVLGEQESEFDHETRWAIHWFSQFYGDEGAYGVAEQLAVSMNVAVSNMVDAGILRSGGGKVRLLRRDELPDDWDPARDTHTPVWEATQHLVKRLETDGEAAAGRLLRRLGGLGESAQLLAYRLYTVCEKAKPNLAGPYNALVASWPEIQRLAREASEPMAAPEQHDLGL